MLVPYFRRWDTKSSTAAECPISRHHNDPAVSGCHRDISLSQKVPEVGHRLHAVQARNGLVDYQIKIWIQMEECLAVFILPGNDHAIDPFVTCGELSSQNRNSGGD